MRRRSRKEPWGDETGSRVRVLLECEPEMSPSIIAPVIERHGYAVRTCDGPAHDGCDLLEDGACALVDGADVVVNMLHAPVDAPLVRNAVSSTRRPPAVVAEMTPAELHASSDGEEANSGFAPDRVTVLQSPINTTRLMGAIEEAVRRQGMPLPIWGDGFS